MEYRSDIDLDPPTTPTPEVGANQLTTNKPAKGGLMEHPMHQKNST